MAERTRYGCNDEHVLVAIARGELTADPSTGHVNYRGRAVGNARPDGYLFCSIRRMAGLSAGWVTIPLHRVVWMVCHAPIPPGMVVNHRNGRRWDNRFTNLEMATPSDNTRHAKLLPYAAVGLNGDDNCVSPEWWAQVRHMAARTEVDMAEIRALLPQREPESEVIARRLITRPIHTG